MKGNGIYKIPMLMQRNDIYLMLEIYLMNDIHLMVNPLTMTILDIGDSYLLNVGEQDLLGEWYSLDVESLDDDPLVRFCREIPLIM